jgi:hypothetical protein
MYFHTLQNSAQFFQELLYFLFILTANMFLPSGSGTTIWYLSIMLHSYTVYSVFNATTIKNLLFYFTTCFGHKRPSLGVLFAKLSHCKL